MMVRKIIKLIVVTSPTSLISVPANGHVINITNIGRVFPAIHEFKPDSIVLDHDYLGVNTERILRRLTSNPFYKKIKIYCYKSTSHTKMDDFLKVLGVQFFIYDEDVKWQKQKNTTLKAFSEMLEARMAHTLDKAGYKTAI